MNPTSVEGSTMGHRRISVCQTHFTDGEKEEKLAFFNLSLKVDWDIWCRNRHYLV